MRIIKPICTSIIHRCLEHQGRFFFSASVIASMPLSRPLRLLSEQKLWPALAQYAPSFTEDGIIRSQSEFLVYGRVHPPAADLKQLPFGIRIGDLSKKCRAFGHRRLVQGQLEQYPVESIPLDPQYAYGGPQYALNPQGTGHASSQQGDTLVLPRLERIDRPWQAEEDLNQPALFGQLDMMHPLRQQHRGTYDEHWLKKNYPGLPDDAHWAIYNTAYPDQRQKAPFQGRESFDLLHLHPQQSHVQGQLPGITAKLIYQLKTDERLHLIDTQLRSLVFICEADLLLLIWQGQFPIASDDAHEIQDLMVALEWLDQPKSLTHYRIYKKRYLDPEYGILYGLDESPLLPENCPYDDILQGSADLNTIDPPMIQTRMRQKAERNLAEARQKAIDHGQDPDELGLPEKMPAPEALPSIQELPQFIQKIEREAEQRKQAQLEQQAAAMTPKSHSGPPQSIKAQTIDQLQQAEQMADEQQASLMRSIYQDPFKQQQWQQLDELALQGYRLGAHHQSPYQTRPKDEALRQKIQKMVAAGQSLAGMDLSGADLSGLDLSGADLKAALLESANLSQCNLSGACLASAVLAHANLSQAKLIQTNLHKANLGKANLAGADLSQADLREAILDEKTCFSGAVLQGADLSGSQCFQLDLSQLNLSQAHLDNAQFLQCQMQGVDLSQARLFKTSFIQCDLRQSRWADCQGEKTSFVDIQAQGMDCRQARLIQSQWVGSEQPLDLSGLNFERADLSQAYFAPGTLLIGAVLNQLHAPEIQLSGVKLHQARLQKAYLRQANLRYAELVQADLSQTDLMEALLAQADFSGAYLYQTHFFRADLARIRTDAQTRVRDVIYDQAKVYPRYEKN